MNAGLLLVPQYFYTMLLLLSLKQMVEVGADTQVKGGSLPGTQSLSHYLVDKLKQCIVQSEPRIYLLKKCWLTRGQTNEQTFTERLLKLNAWRLDSNVCMEGGGSGRAALLAHFYGCFMMELIKPLFNQADPSTREHTDSVRNRKSLNSPDGRRRWKVSVLTRSVHFYGVNSGSTHGVWSWWSDECWSEKWCAEAASAEKRLYGQQWWVRYWCPGVRRRVQIHQLVNTPYVRD